MKKILVTTDFSPAAQNAVNLAAHIANKLGCTLSLFHCYNIPVPVGDMPFPPVPVSEIEEQIALAFKKQASLVHSQFPNMVVETGCQAGLASEDIIKVANSDNDILLVVMGITGTGRAGQWLFGSTSVSVAKACQKPVVIVPEDASWIPLKEILFACDFRDLDNVFGMDVFFKLVELDKPNIKILNVVEPGQLPSANQAINGVKLERELSTLKHTYHFIENKNVESGLDEFLKDKQVQLIVMVRRKHNWFERLISGGHTKKMAYHSHVPLMVLHEM